MSQSPDFIKVITGLYGIILRLGNKKFVEIGVELLNRSASRAKNHEHFEESIRQLLQIFIRDVSIHTISFDFCLGTF